MMIFFPVSHYISVIILIRLPEPNAMAAVKPRNL